MPTFRDPKTESQWVIIKIVIFVVLAIGVMRTCNENRDQDIEDVVMDSTYEQ